MKLFSFFRLTIFGIFVQKHRQNYDLVLIIAFCHPQQQGEECLDCPDELVNEQMDPLVDIMEKEHLDTGKQVVAGICAMAKKSNSKPMREILARLDEFDYIKTIIFPEETILKVFLFV